MTFFACLTALGALLSLTYTSSHASALKLSSKLVSAGIIGGIAGVILLTIAAVLLVQWRRRRNTSGKFGQDAQPTFPRLDLGGVFSGRANRMQRFNSAEIV